MRCWRRCAVASGASCCWPPAAAVPGAVFTAIWVERLMRIVGAPMAFRALNLAWVLAIAWSTVAIRQHVVLDAVAGAALGTLISRSVEFTIICGYFFLRVVFEPMEGDVTVRVDYSTLNYKDGLAITGKGPIVRQFPMIPGIDLTGEVIGSKSPEFKVGDLVVLNGWGVGESHWGGLAQLASVKSEWLIPLPKAFTSKQSLAIGTAGYTAMLCIMALEKHGLKPADGEILVTELPDRHPFQSQSH